MLEVVLKDWVTETKETSNSSKSSTGLAKSASERVRRRPCRRRSCRSYGIEPALKDLVRLDAPARRRTIRRRPTQLGDVLGAAFRTRLAASENCRRSTASRTTSDPSRRILSSDSRGWVTGIRARSGGPAAGKMACFRSSLVCTICSRDDLPTAPK